VREAYERVAPSALAKQAAEALEVPTKVQPLTLVERDPLQGKRAQSVLKAMRKLCLALPEVSEGLQFGSPVWRAGKKGFAVLDANARSVRLLFWIGAGGQSLVSADPRFSVPAYMGHNGWIALDVTKSCDWDEVRAITLTSYRHFALQRMLKALDAGK